MQTEGELALGATLSGHKVSPVAYFVAIHTAERDESIRLGFSVGLQGSHLNGQGPDPTKVRFSGQLRGAGSSFWNKSKTPGTADLRYRVRPEEAGHSTRIRSKKPHLVASLLRPQESLFLWAGPRSRPGPTECSCPFPQPVASAAPRVQLREDGQK